MARRINFYGLIRLVHLYSAFTVMVFLLMYFITGYLILRPGWFSREIAEAYEQILSVDIPDDLAAPELARVIQDSLEIGGKREGALKDEQGIFHFEYTGPGRAHSVTADPESNEVVVSTRELNTFQTVTAFHRLHKYTGPLLYDVFILMMDAASFALLLFVVSGMILWLKLLKRKLWGILALGGGFAYTIWVILSFLYG